MSETPQAVDEATAADTALGRATPPGRAVEATPTRQQVSCSNSDPKLDLPETPTPSKGQHTTHLSAVQLKVQQARQANESNALMSRFLLSNSVRHLDPVAAHKNPGLENATATAGGSPPTPQGQSGPDAVSSVAELQRREALGSSGSRELVQPRFKNRQVFRRKLVLLGYQEVGKTSLRKCFESEPFFFKRLPDVRTTTGVEVNEVGLRVDGESIELILSDFAGQETYHSHTFFLTDRSLFGLVWKISAVEQDFNSSGINVREEERLYTWIAEVYAKFPRARIVLIATHLDELRVQGQRSVEMVLNKVEGKIRSFLDRIARHNGNVLFAEGGGEHYGWQDTIVGNFAVSCKTRLIIGAGEKGRQLSGKKISALLHYLAEVARDDCIVDREYPSGAVPGRHAKLIESIEQLKKQQPGKLLMSINELVSMALGLGVESDDELLQVARLMHTWNIIYLLNPHRIEDNPFVMLYPRWLSRMAAALFSFAHVLRTPLHLRSFIGGLEYTISHAEAADLFLMRKGFLRWPLARVLFHKSLADFLKRSPDDSDVSMCLQLLEAMNVLYPVTVPCDEFAVLMEETPIDPDVGRPVIRQEAVTRFFIPSLSPQKMPTLLRRIAPVLFHRGVRVKLDFNFLPDELWWRLQCKLAAYVQEVVVHQPYCPTADGIDDDDQAVLFDGFRLKEADDEHNRWKDAMWLFAPKCRVLVYRESLTTVSILSAETELRASESVMQAVEDGVSELLDEYQGVRRTTLVACPTPSCEGWLPTEVVASSVTLTCATCGRQFNSDAVIEAGANPQQPQAFSEALLEEVGGLLSFCLSYPSCLHMCHYLGVQYRGPVPDRERTPGGTVKEISQQGVSTEAHAEYLHALDKVVQASLFRSWMERVQERERQRRMLELNPFPVLY